MKLLQVILLLVSASSLNALSIPLNSEFVIPESTKTADRPRAAKLRVQGNRDVNYQNEEEGSEEQQEAPPQVNI